MASKTKSVNPYLLTVVMIILTMFSAHSLLFFSLSIFIVPVLISYIICNHCLRHAIYTAVSSTIFYMTTAVVTKICAPEDIFKIAFLMLPGFSIGLCFTKQGGFRETMFFSVFADSVVFLVLLAVSKYLLKFNLTQEIRDAIVFVFDAQSEILKNIAPDIGEIFSQYGFEIFNIMYLMLPGLVPFSILTIFIIIALVRYAFAKIVCAEFFVRTSKFTDGFDTFRVGLVTNIVLIISGVVMLSTSSAKLSIACTNIVLVVFLLYFVTAISNIEYKLKYKIRYPSTRFLVITFIIICAILLTTMFPVANFFYIFVFFGFMDSLFDFRRLNINKR